MKIKDLILKTEKVNWQELEDLQPISSISGYPPERSGANPTYTLQKKRRTIYFRKWK